MTTSISSYRVIALSNPDKLYKIAAASALVMAVIIPVQVFLFLSSPPPQSVEDYFRLFRDNAILGLLQYDVLMMVDMVLMIFIYVSLYYSLKNVDEPLTTMAFTLGLLGTGLFLVSNTSFEMLSLSNQYASAKTSEQRNMLLAAGQSMYEIYHGTAFMLYYLLSALSLLLFTALMFRSKIFSRGNAYAGLFAGLLMLVPPIPATGMTGLVFSVLSLLPWAAWLIFFGTRLLRLSKTEHFVNYNER